MTYENYMLRLVVCEIIGKKFCQSIADYFFTIRGCGKCYNLSAKQILTLAHEATRINYALNRFMVRRSG